MEALYFYASAVPAMKITRLQAQNFKSFDSVDVELGDLNVFIGPNASGKSNFLSILTFLRDIARDGLENAVSMQGGIEFIRNVQIDTKVNTSFHLSFQSPPANSRLSELTQSQAPNPNYRLVVKHGETSNYHIENERIAAVGSSLLDLSTSERKKLTVERNSDGSIKWVPPVFQFEENLPERRSVLEDTFMIITGLDLPGSIAIYNFSVPLQKKISDFSGKNHLEEDGSNVAFVLHKLLQDEEKRRKFLNLARALLPFVEDLDVDRFSGKSLLVKLQESYAEETYLPESLLSDGTIKVVALLIALYFDDRPVVAFEEPATSLHPKLISQLMQMMREASEEKQIFLTTHNPEVIRHVDLDDIYLVSRDEDGFSQVKKPSDSEVVHHFLENELGIDDLFVDDLLSL